ncbi:hypothetical protein MSKU3_1186 [Komagataeibacter oboediens]|nr:hypothetical protein MSKU3_1186 [Komagataeibacter oboediens]
MSMVMVRPKRSVMTDAPPDEREVICSSPDISPSCVSSGAVTEVAITSGLAPG